MVADLEHKTVSYAQHNVTMAYQLSNNPNNKCLQEERHAVVVGKDFVLLKYYQDRYNFKTFTYSYNKDTDCLVGKTLEALSEDMLAMLVAPPETTKPSAKKIRGAKNKVKQAKLRAEQKELKADEYISKPANIQMIEDEFGLTANDIAFTSNKNIKNIIPAKTDSNIDMGAGMDYDNFQGGLKTMVANRNSYYATEVVGFLIDLKDGLETASFIGLSHKADYRF